MRKSHDAVSSMVALTILASAGCSDAGAEHEIETESNELTGKFGQQSPGTMLRGASADYVRASRYSLSSPSTITKLTAYVGGAPGADGATSQSIRGVVYASDASGGPGALVCTTRDEIVASSRAADWLALSFDETCALPRGRYWLGIHTGPGDSVIRYGASAATNALVHGRDGFADGARPAFPDRYRDNYRLAIYATATDGAATTPPTSPPPPPPPPSTSLDYVKVDTADVADPLPKWGRIDCEVASRHQWFATGGDPHPMADGSPQGNTAFRRLTVNDGDDYYGERCELGSNTHQETTFVNFHEGERRHTYFSLRLAPSYPLSSSAWQVVAQMKQAQPASNGGGTPVLALEARSGRWSLTQSTSVTASEDTRELWSAPAQTGVWTRFKLDVFYSQDASKGSIQMFVDLDGDNDFDGPEEASPVMKTYTLKRETAGSTVDDIGEGESIPGHLRMGPYHNADLPGTYVDVDNVQVVIP